MAVAIDGSGNLWASNASCVTTAAADTLYANRLYIIGADRCCASRPITPLANQDGGLFAGSEPNLLSMDACCEGPARWHRLQAVLFQGAPAAAHPGLVFLVTGVKLDDATFNSRIPSTPLRRSFPNSRKPSSHTTKVMPHLQPTATFADEAFSLRAAITCRTLWNHASRHCRTRTDPHLRYLYRGRPRRSLAVEPGQFFRLPRPQRCRQSPLPSRCSPACLRPHLRAPSKSSAKTSSITPSRSSVTSASCPKAWPSSAS